MRLLYISPWDLPQGKGEQLVWKEGQGGTDTSQSRSHPWNSKLGYGLAPVWYAGLCSPRWETPHGRSRSSASPGTDAAYGGNRILLLFQLISAKGLQGILMRLGLETQLHMGRSVRDVILATEMRQEQPPAIAPSQISSVWQLNCFSSHQNHAFSLSTKPLKAVGLCQMHCSNFTQN